MSQNSSVVVGISTFNRSDILRQSIRSALSQSHRPVRVAVIDDASTDDTPAIEGEFPEVSWERFATNQGYLRARNKMMLTATEDYYISLDDDAWFLEGDEIAIAIDYLQRHPNVAAIAYDILSPDRPQKVSRGENRSVACYIGCGHVLRLSKVRELGGYTKLPGFYGGEEMDFCLQLIDRGYEVVELGGVHVWHDKTVTSRDLLKQHRSGVCNDLTLTLLRFPSAALVPVFAWKFFAHLRFGFRNGLLQPCLQGMRDFMRSVFKTWRARRPIKRVSVKRIRALARNPQVVG